MFDRSIIIFVLVLCGLYFLTNSTTERKKRKESFSAKRRYQLQHKKKCHKRAQMRPFSIGKRKGRNANTVSTSVSSSSSSDNSQDRERKKKEREEREREERERQEKERQDRERQASEDLQRTSMMFF